MNHGAHRIDRCALFLAAAALAIGCATAPEPDPDSTIIWGHVHLIPKAGTDKFDGGYGDRRVAQAKRIDYSQMKFAVVFVPTALNETLAPAELSIHDSENSFRIEPQFASTTPTAGIRVTNATSLDRIVSVPGTTHVDRIAAGESTIIRGLSPGESSVYLLGLPQGESPDPAQVWVTEGVTAEVEPNGRYTLRGLAPGRHQVRAWHPRLPPSPIHPVELTRGSVLRLDLEIGVDVHALDTVEPQ
jgi:hypothetical protein